MDEGRTICGLVPLASAKNCSLLGLDTSTLWNLFGLVALDVVLRSLCVASRRAWRESPGSEHVVNLNVDWPFLFGTIGYTIS